MSLTDAQLLDAIDERDRRKAQRSLIAFTEYTKRDYTAAPHHLLIAEKLEAVERGEIDRLMVFMPPRHGKSELVSRRFPVWYLGRNPHREVIVASYSTDLARTFGRDARDIAKAPTLAEIASAGRHIAEGERFRGLNDERWGFEVSTDTSSKEEWKTTAGGGFVAAGVGKGITGRGANVIIIDDPVKDREEAESETIRENVWDWYTSTLYTRLENPGAIIVCQTRWHEDDLSGRLLEAMKADEGDDWHVLSLPALQDGRALWPEKYDVDALERIRRAVGSRDWQALYQQQPAPDDGDYFKREDFRYYDELPDNVRKFAASDLATDEDTNLDYTVHMVGALDADDNLYLEDVWREQADAQVWADGMASLIRMHEPLRWGQFKGAIWRVSQVWVMKLLRDAKAYVDVAEYPDTQDKPTKARAAQVRSRNGKLFFKRDARWLDDLEPELLSFPAGKHDDQVDTLGLLARMAAEIGAPGRKPQRQKRYRAKAGARRVRWA